VALGFAIAGIVVGLVGALLLYFFQDHRFGSSILLESANVDRDNRYARLGLALVVLGSGLQTVAVVIATG
jgi:1,4-dihydroxy-2-naphthoate octaprenyltransferase